MSLKTERPPTSSIAASRRDDLITALLGSWLTIGGFVDGFAHRNLDTPETFFTPWHAILYTGYLTTGAWVFWLVVRNRRVADSLRGSIPTGYETTVVGLGVFAAGGIGDGVWHSIFGIEVSVDALLSPTHLLLLTGALLIVSGPLRSAWIDRQYDPLQIGQFWPPLLAVTMAAAELGFFFQYLDGLSIRFMQVPYTPGIEEGFFELVAGFSSMLITTTIIMGALLLLARRWVLPLGSALFLFAAFGGLMETLEGFDFPEDLVAPVVAGLTAEILLRYLLPKAPRPLGIRLVALGVPVVLWSVRFAVFEQFSDINWPTSVWTGAIFFTGLVGVGLSLLAFPPEPAASP